MRSTPLSPQKLLGLRVKELRVMKSITQEELAERCGMFRTYMSRIETGLANPTLTMLYTMAQALEVDIAQLFIAPQPTPARVLTQNPVSRGRVR